VKQVRLTQLAQDDIRNILDTSASMHGEAASGRYRALLGSAFRQIQANPIAAPSAACDRLAPGLRSLHLARCRRTRGKGRVENPVHLVFYRLVSAEAILIVRVLHERMELGRHLANWGNTP